MSSWSETLQLPRPLRGVHSAGDGASGGQPAQEEQPAGYERGRRDGEQALSEQLLKQRAEFHEMLQGVVSSLRQAVPQVVHQAESLMVSLAFEVAQKLVTDMPISVPMIEAAVRDALAQVEGTAKFTVRLHPADLELLQKAESPILTPGEGPDDFRFLGSPEVTRGGCLVQTQFGTVDARRETKFDLLKRSLLS